MLPALRQVAEAKAGEDGVRRVIAKRFETYPQPQRSDEGWAAWWADYFDVLADLSLASLEAGMRAYVALSDSEFMPKPGKLRELAFSAPCRALQRLHRATIAIQMAEQPAPVTPAPLSEADRAAIAKIADDFKAKSLSDATKLKPALPSIAGAVDEGGITSEMRELIARRQAAGHR